MFEDAPNSYAASDDDVDNRMDDAVHDALVDFAEDTLAMMYDIRVKHPDAIIDDKPIDDCIAQLESSLAEARRINTEYAQMKKQVLEMRAQLIYVAEIAVHHLFFSYATLVGHWRPTPSFLQGYFDVKEARGLIARNRFLPDHHNN